MRRWVVVPEEIWNGSFRVREISRNVTLSIRSMSSVPFQSVKTTPPGRLGRLAIERLDPIPPCEVALEGPPGRLPPGDRLVRPRRLALLDALRDLDPQPRQIRQLQLRPSRVDHGSLPEGRRGPRAVIGQGARHPLAGDLPGEDEAVGADAGEQLASLLPLVHVLDVLGDLGPQVVEIEVRVARLE